MCSLSLRDDVCWTVFPETAEAAMTAANLCQLDGSCLIMPAAYSIKTSAVVDYRLFKEKKIHIN